MAKFDEAYNITMNTEGGFANNPDDHGGMTVMGISRKNWPRWAGWQYVDQVLAGVTVQPPYGSKEYFAWAKVVNSRLKSIPAFLNLVSAFYRVNFWDNNRLSEINDQGIANKMFDIAVNNGSCAWMQEAAGVTADGAVGPKTIGAINKLPPSTLKERYIKVATAHRLAIVEHDPSQKQFLASWKKRDCA